MLLDFHTHTHTKTKQILKHDEAIDLEKILILSAVCQTGGGQGITQLIPSNINDGFVLNNNKPYCVSYTTFQF